MEPDRAWMLRASANYAILREDLSGGNSMSQPYHQPHQYQERSEPQFVINLITHTGALIFWHERTRTHVGTLAECEQQYQSAQLYCFLAGWWSLASALFCNWIALFSNMIAIRRVRKLSQDPHAVAALQDAIHQTLQQAATGPGWHPDPSGQPGQRYWDGATWTNFTHPPRH
jgi:Protein of unknown function (DUF2510)